LSEISLNPCFTFPTVKMGSNYVYKALDNYASFYQKLEKLPIQWNPNHRKFVHSSNPKTLLAWKMNCFLGMIISNGLIVFLLIREIVFPTNSFSKFFIFCQITMCTFAFLWMVEGMAALVLGEEYVFCWNQSEQFLVKLLKGEQALFYNKIHNQ